MADDADDGPPSRLAPGATIGRGKFRIERVVGQGGMGLVVEATNLDLDQRVALKFLRQDVERSPAVVERFANEARAAVKLRSEHVARVSDVGSHPVFGPYMVMDLLEGCTLAEALAQDAGIPPHRAIEYVIDACEGLAEAHARGIVHQDVKPANLFLARGTGGRPIVKVLDFGISKAPLDGATVGDASLGSPHYLYLSPEQVRRAADIDARADVWALGCVLYELLTGHKPFQAAQFTELVARILEAPPAPLPPGLELPPRVLEIIDQCLEKDREKRFANTGQLALALLPFARPRSHSVASRAVAHVRDAGLDPQLTMPSSMPPPPRPSDGIVDLLQSSESLRAPLVPRFEPVGAASPGSLMPTAAAPASGSRAGLLFGAAAAVALLFGAALWLRGVQEDAALASPPVVEPRAPGAGAAAGGGAQGAPRAGGPTAESSPVPKPSATATPLVASASPKGAASLGARAPSSAELPAPAPAPATSAAESEIRGSR
jgi:serine/threonine-protein kinase